MFSKILSIAAIATLTISQSVYAGTVTGTSMTVLFDKNGKIIGATVIRNGKVTVNVNKRAGLPKGQPSRTFGGGARAIEGTDKETA